MHDGAGAWLKSAVARACLAGVGIHTAQEFFQYCLQFLSSNLTSSNFTNERHYYLISVETSEMYRATMPAKVKGSQKILGTKTDQTGWFFWASTDVAGEVVQRRCACPCDRCQVGDFSACLKKGADSSNGRWWNEPIQQVLPHLILCMTVTLTSCCLQTLTATVELKGRSRADCVAFMKSVRDCQACLLLPP